MEGKECHEEDWGLAVPTWYEGASHCVFLEPSGKTLIPQLHSDFLRIIQSSFHQVVYIA